MKPISLLRGFTCQWDHTVLPATRQRRPPRHNPSWRWYSIHLPVKDERLSWPEKYVLGHRCWKWCEDDSAWVGWSLLRRRWLRTETPEEQDSWPNVRLDHPSLDTGSGAWLQIVSDGYWEWPRVWADNHHRVRTKHRSRATHSVDERESVEHWSSSWGATQRHESIWCSWTTGNDIECGNLGAEDHVNRFTMSDRSP